MNNEQELNDDETTVLDHQPSCLGDEDQGGEDSHLESQYEERTELPDDGEDHGWPGDGSGTDDLADHNANEVGDYHDEGREDGAFEAYDGD